MDCHGRRLQGVAQTPLRVAVGTAATEGGSGIGTEPTRRPPVDLRGATAPGPAVPTPDLRLGREARYPGEGGWDCRGNRGVPETRRAEGWRLWQCRPRASGNSPRNRC